MDKTYYIFRHGETFATRDLKWYGFRIFSAPILDDGIPTITALGHYLKSVPSDFQVSSPIFRCRQTSTIVSDITHKPFSYDNRISEYFFEPFRLFRYRLQRFIRSMEQSEYQHIMICTHGAVIAGLTNLIVTNEFHPKQIMDFPKPGVLTIITNKKIKTINFAEEKPH